MKIRVGHLYPDYLNIYADRGNIAVLARRAALRGHELVVAPVSIGDAVAPSAYDLFYVGGGQDHAGTAALGQAEGVGDRPALHVAGARAVGVDDQPRRGGVLGGTQSDHQGLGHTVIRLRSCAAPAAPCRPLRASKDCTG